MRISDWSSDVCSSDLLSHQYLDRLVVENIARAVDQPVLPMTGIGIERDVGEHADVVAKRLLDRGGRSAHEVIRIERLAAVRAAPVGLRIGKEREARDARGDRFLRAIDEEVDRPARYAGQARDRLDRKSTRLN